MILPEDHRSELLATYGGGELTRYYAAAVRDGATNPAVVPLALRREFSCAQSLRGAGCRTLERTMRYWTVWANDCPQRARQLSEVLGGCCEKELIASAVA
jgi:hypothetical protein